jgi:nitrate reductase gamma subunit
MNMRDLPNHLVFGVYPYVVLAVFLIGGWLRFAGEPHFSWNETGPLLRRQQLTWGVTLFHGGILILFLGHFIGLLVPIRVFDALGMSHSFKQWLAIVVGGAAGVAGLVGITILLHRRLFDARGRATSSFADTAFVLLIGIQLALGLGTIVVAFVEYIDGCAVLNFMFWAQDILTLRPAAAVAQVAKAPLLFKLHMVNGMTLFLVLPFTRLVNIWSVPARYLGHTYQRVRSA